MKFFKYIVFWNFKKISNFETICIEIYIHDEFENII